MKHKEGDRATFLLGNEKPASIWTKLEKAYEYNSHANLHELRKKYAWNKINQRLWHLLSARAWPVVSVI